MYIKVWHTQCASRGNLLTTFVQYADDDGSWAGAWSTMGDAATTEKGRHFRPPRLGEIFTIMRESEGIFLPINDFLFPASSSTSLFYKWMWQLLKESTDVSDTFHGNNEEILSSFNEPFQALRSPSRFWCGVAKRVKMPSFLKPLEISHKNLEKPLKTFACSALKFLPMTINLRGHKKWIKKFLGMNGALQCVSEIIDLEPTEDRVFWTPREI